MSEIDVPAAVARMKLLDRAVAVNERTIIGISHRVLAASFGGRQMNRRRIRRKTKILQSEIAYMRIAKLQLWYALLASGKVNMKWNVK